MKKKFLKLMLLICGLNVFTACYGMAPGDWMYELPEQEQEDTKAPADTLEEEAETEDTTVDQ